MNYSSESFDPEEYFKFDDIPTYVGAFTQSSTPENLGNNEQVYNQQISRLEELFQIFTNKVQDMPVPTSHFYSDVSIYISNKILFCSSYLFNKKVKLFRFKEYLYSKTISIIASILSKMKKSKEEDSKIIYCQIDELEIFLKDKIKNNNYVLKNQDKIERLISFIHPKSKTTEIPIQQLKAALEESIKNLNNLCDYSIYGSFDDFLYYYVYLSNPKKIVRKRFPFLSNAEKNFVFHLEKFEEEESKEEDDCIDCLIDDLVKISIENFKKTNFVSFHSENDNISYKIIEEKIYSLLDIQKPEEQIILKTSLIRIIFDRLYQHQEFIDLISSRKDQVNSVNFQKKCEEMCLKTANEMQISSSLLIDELMNKPFKSIIENDETYLKKAMEFLEFLPFYTNPIDILSHIYLSLKECESFLKSQNNQIIDCKEINPDVVIDENNNEENNNISFDDIFPIFCAVLGYCHPSNCLEISHFLDIIKGFVFNSQLNYANSIFISAVSYINADM